MPDNKLTEITADLIWASHRSGDFHLWTDEDLKRAAVWADDNFGDAPITEIVVTEIGRRVVAGRWKK